MRGRTRRRTQALHFPFLRPSALPTYVRGQSLRHEERVSRTQLQRQAERRWEERGEACVDPPDEFATFIWAFGVARAGCDGGRVIRQHFRKQFSLPPPNRTAASFMRRFGNE